MDYVDWNEPARLRRLRIVWLLFGCLVGFSLRSAWAAPVPAVWHPGEESGAIELAQVCSSRNQSCGSKPCCAGLECIAGACKDAPSTPSTTPATSAPTTRPQSTPAPTSPTTTRPDIPVGGCVNVVGKLCDSDGTTNNPTCCPPLVCPPAGTSKNHCAVSTTPTTLRPTTTTLGECIMPGLLCGPKAGPYKACCTVDGVQYECRQAEQSGGETGHAMCLVARVTTTTRPPAPVTTTTKPSVTTTTRPPTPQPGGTPPFVMPTGRDLSITLKREQRCKFIAGRTATQVERAAMYILGTAKLQPEGLLYAKYHPNCSGISATAGLEVDDTRLRVFYVDPERNGVWNILSDNGCPDYEHVQTLGEKIHACSLGSATAKTLCAASKYMNQSILDWADLRIVGGKCEAGGARPVIPATEDKALAQIGMLDYRVPVPPTPPNVAAAQAHVVAVHHQSDHAYCEGGTSGGGFQAAHSAMLALADPLDRRLQHSLFLVFTGVADEGAKGWTRQQVCDWKLLEGIAMKVWGDCTAMKNPTRPDGPALTPKDVWPCRTRTRVTHETLHRCAALKNTGKIRIGNHDSAALTGRPVETCEAFLKCQTGETPNCRRPWVPDPSSWRHMVTPTSGPQ